MRWWLVPSLTVTSAYLDLIRRGQKTSTVRTRCSLSPGDTFTFTNYRTRLQVVCTAVEQRTLQQLTHRDAQADGFANASELRAALMTHYPALTPWSRVFVIRFSLHSGSKA